MKTLAQLDNSVRHLNEILEDKGLLPYYCVEPITGTDKFTLYLETPHHTHKICTSDSATMYQSIIAIKHVEQTRN
jgi:hypothetical protein